VFVVSIAIVVASDGRFLRALECVGMNRFCVR